MKRYRILRHKIITQKFVYAIQSQTRYGWANEKVEREGIVYYAEYATFEMALEILHTDFIESTDEDEVVYESWK
jgi:hypothetical protein